MNNIKNISLFSLICFLLNFTLLQMLLDLPLFYAKTAKTAVVILSIYNFILVMGFILLVCKLYKKFMGFNIIDIIKFAFGIIWQKIITTFFILIFLSYNIIFLREISEACKIIVFSDTPLLYISIFYSIAMILSCSAGLEGIIRASEYLVTTSIALILLVFFLSLPFLNPQRLFPILGSGIPRVLGFGTLNIAAYSGIPLLLLISKYIKNNKEYKKISVIYTIISFILITITVSIIIMSFGYSYVASDLFSLYEISKSANLSTVFQRTEIIYIIPLLLCTFLFLVSIFTGLSMCINSLFNHQETDNKSVIILIRNIIILIIIVILSNIPSNIYKIFEIREFLSTYLIIPTSFLLPLLILIIANIKAKKDRSSYEKFINNNC